MHMQINAYIHTHIYTQSILTGTYVVYVSLKYYVLAFTHNYYN